MSRAAGLLIARGWMNLCAIVSFFVIGRFLAPAEFGIYALASSAILLPMGLLGAGFSEHVISRDPEKRDEATAFWATAATGLAFTAIAWAIAAVVMFVFHHTTYAQILFWLSPLPALYGLSVILESMLIRDDRTGVMSSVTVAGESIGLVALILAAMAGLGVMSLVVSRLINNTILLVGYRFFTRTPPLRDVNRATAKSVGKFSLGVLGARAVNWIDAYGVELVLGALLPAAAIGHYRMAGRLNAALGSVLVFAPWQAQLAYLSERHRIGRMGAAITRTITMHASLIAPLFAGLAILSSDVIGLLLGPQWRPTALVLSIMALASIVQVVWAVSTASLVASGQSKRLFAFQAANVFVAVAALAVGALGGLTIAAALKFSMTSLLSIISLFVLTTISPYQRGKLLSLIARLALVTAALAASMLAALSLLPANGDVWTTLARIALGGVAGLAGYGAALYLFAPESIRIARLFIRKRFKREPILPTPAPGAAS